MIRSIPVSPRRAFLLTSALAWLPVSLTAQDDLLYRTFQTPKAALTLPGNALIDLREEGSVEFWLRHRWTDAEFAYRKPAKGDEVPPASDYFGYSPVLAVGDRDNLAFAVVMNNAGGDGKTGSLLGVVPSLDHVGSERDRFAELTNNQIVGGVVGVQTENTKARLASGELVHVAIVKHRGEDNLRIWVNGLEMPGSVRGSFGDTRGKAIRIGWDVGANPYATEPDENGLSYLVSEARPFRGDIGGVRFYGKALGDESIRALFALGATPDPIWLRRIDECGDLLAWLDMRPFRIDRNSGEVGSAAAQLVLGDPLLGSWFADGARAIPPRLDGPVPGRIPDPAVYTIESAYTTKTTRCADRYRMYEDAIWIGDLVRIAGGDDDDSNWRLEPCDPNATRLMFRLRREVQTDGRPRWKLRCEHRTDATSTLLQGEFTRPTIALQDLPNHRPGTKDVVTRQMERLNDDMAKFFVFNNNQRYHAVLYRGFDPIRMDGYKLFDEIGLRREVLRQPKDSEYQLRNSDKVYLPFNLAYCAVESGDASVESTVIRNASDYSRQLTMRLGATINVSVKGGVNFIAQGEMTVGTDIGFQAQLMKEWSGAVRTESTVITSQSRYLTCSLQNKKELMEVTPEFRQAVWQLRSRLTGADPSASNALFDEFFHAWGTHYALGAVFGVLGYWETRIDNEEIENQTKTDASLYRKIGQGDTGAGYALGDGFKSFLENRKATGRVVGGGTSPTDQIGPVSAGADPVPVFADLRPITDLLSPQYFPGAPEIYNEFSAQLVDGMFGYCNRESLRALAELYPDAKGQPVKDGPFAGITVSRRDVEASLKDISANGKNAIADKIGVALAPAPATNNDLRVVECNLLSLTKPAGVPDLCNDIGGQLDIAVNDKVRSLLVTKSSMHGRLANLAKLPSFSAAINEYFKDPNINNGMRVIGQMQGWKKTLGYVDQVRQQMNPPRPHDVGFGGSATAPVRWLVRQGQSLAMTLGGLQEAGLTYSSGSSKVDMRDYDFTLSMQLPAAPDGYPAGLAAPMAGVVADLQGVKQLNDRAQALFNSKNMPEQIMARAFRPQYDQMVKALDWDPANAAGVIQYLEDVSGKRAGIIRARSSPRIDARIRMRVLPDPIEVLMASSSNRFGPFETLSQGKGPGAPRFATSYKTPPPPIDPLAWRGEIRQTTWRSALQGRPDKEAWIIDAATGLACMTSDRLPWNQPPAGSVLYLQFDVAPTPQAMWFGPAADLGDTGLIEIDDKASPALGPMVRLRASDANQQGREGIDVRLPGGRVVSGSIPAGIPCRLRLEMDLGAKAGAGLGTVRYANLAAQPIEWQTVPGLSDLPLNLDPKAKDARNPDTWTSICLRFGMKLVGGVEQLESGWLR